MQWSGHDIQKLLELNTGFADWHASGVSIDSRTVASGELFIALRGEHFDGHDYIADALDRGAVAIIAEQFYPTPEGIGLFEVHDTLEALQQIAEQARHRLTCEVIGITGSVGKTTTKEMLHEAFSHLGKTHASRGNFNNHIGLPLVLANCPEDLDYLILEMGMNHAGEISFLTKLGKPDLAIITNVKPAHMLNFDDIAGVASAKAEIFASSPAKALFIGDDEEISPMLVEACESAKIKEVRTFGIHNNALTKSCHYKLQSIKAGKNPKITAKFQRKAVEYNIGIFGEHSATNSMIALSAVDMMVDNFKDYDILKKFKAPKGRGELSQINIGRDGTATLIDESYNASPSAVSASLSLLQDVKKLHKGKRAIAILGDMLELGHEEISYHEGIASDIKNCEVDKLITVGSRMKHLFEAVPDSKRIKAYDDTQDLMSDIWNYLKNDDIILVKGSHSIGLDKIVTMLQEG